MHNTYYVLHRHHRIIPDHKRRPTKLEASVASLIENASSDKSEVSEQMKEIKSSVALVKSRLTTKIDNLAVSYNQFYIL